MVNRIIIISTLLVIFSSSVESQKLDFRPEVSFGTFNMDDLKGLQNAYTSHSVVNIKSISSFPAYWGYGMSLIAPLRSGFSVGISSEFYSTGARNFYGDYSGYYSFDLLARSFNEGVLGSYKIRLDSSHAIILELSQGIKFSYLREQEKLSLNHNLTNDYNNFRSLSYWFKPVIRYEYTISGSFKAGVYFGAEFNPQSYLYLKGRNDIYLTGENQHKISINWSGLRFGIHCTFDLTSKANNVN